MAARASAQLESPQQQPEMRPRQQKAIYANLRVLCTEDQVYISSRATPTDERHKRPRELRRAGGGTLRCNGNFLHRSLDIEEGLSTSTEVQ